MNAALGAVATVVLSFVPLSPVLGGALAGYLQEGETGSSLRVGALSGAIAVIPMIGVLLLFGGIFALLPLGFAAADGGLGIPAGALSVVVLFALFVLFVVAVLYTVGLGALGGLLGGYVRREDVL